MKTTEPRMGKPPKMPTGDLPEYVPTGIRKIFEACGAPKTWGDKEFYAAWKVVLAPHYPGTMCDDKTFTRMWVEAREALIKGMRNQDAMIKANCKQNVMIKVMHRLYLFANKVRNARSVAYMAHYSYLLELAKGPRDNPVAEAARDRLRQLRDEKKPKHALNALEKLRKM